MRLYFSQLTGVQLDDTFDKSAANKFKRILHYFQFVHTKPSSTAVSILNQTLDGGDVTCAAVLIAN